MQVGPDAKHDGFPATEASARIRIVLVEDHAILREGLKALIELEPDFQVIAEFDGVESSLACIRDLQPDVVLTDLALPDRSGIDLLSEMRTLSPSLANWC